MKQNLLFLFLLTLIISCQSNDTGSQLINYTKNNYKLSNKYFIYGSVLRSLVHLSSADQESVEALKNLEKITYFNIPTENSNSVFQELVDKSKSYQLEEFLTFEKGGINILPSKLQDFAQDAKEVTILMKEVAGVTDCIVVVMRKTEEVTVIITDGKLSINELSKIKLDDTEKIENTFKNLPNIF